MNQSRHAQRRFPLSRSPSEFACGARTGVHRTCMPRVCHCGIPVLRADAVPIMDPEPIERLVRQRLPEPLQAQARRGMRGPYTGRRGCSEPCSASDNQPSLRRAPHVWFFSTQMQHYFATPFLHDSHIHCSTPVCPDAIHPKAGFRGSSTNQLASFGRHAGATATTMTGFPRSEETESLSVPTNHRLRFDDDQCRTPAPPKLLTASPRGSDPKG